jgi:hypothetical protein
LNELDNKLHAQLYTVLRDGAIQSLCQQPNGAWFGPELFEKQGILVGLVVWGGRKLGWSFEKT